jgi:argininosuccinate lyase
MWSGRFRQPLDPEFERWQRSFPFDQRLLGEELAASRAHARALHGAGVLTRDELNVLLGGLNRMGEMAAGNARFLDDEDAEDVHHFVEKQLITLVGDVGRKLHTGRSRNEQIATDLRLFVRGSIDGLLVLIADWLEALVAKAGASGEAAMPAYTHLQRAEPVLVAHWLLAYAEMFFRDADRLRDCRRRVDHCPLGSGAVAGATLPLDRDAMAAELGFAQPTANSMDATSDRDFALEFVQALTQMSLHLSRWAEEMVLYSSREFAFVILPESHATGSSAMPQKKNPDAAELIRAQCARILADATALAVTLKGLPLAYNKDMQETQRPIFSAADAATSTLRVATAFLRGLDFDHARMQAAAQSGYMNATAAANYLVARGVPFRRAHELIGAAVQLGVEKGCELQDLPLDQLRALAPEFDQGIYAALTLDAVLASHDVSGGTAPARVARAMKDAQQRLAALRGEVHAHA